jgi:hypothetical protein
MAIDETYTYTQAKNVFDTLDLFETALIKVKNVPIFRKHLSEMIKRKESEKRFTTTLNKNQLEVIRIK